MNAHSFCDAHISLVEDVSEIKNDIKWLVEDRKKANHLVEKHLVEGDVYRKKVDSNLAWRNALIWVVGVLLSVQTFIIIGILFNGSK